MAKKGGFFIHLSKNLALINIQVKLSQAKEYHSKFIITDIPCQINLSSKYQLKLHLKLNSGR
jgi:hypothetical protein